MSGVFSLNCRTTLTALAPDFMPLGGNRRDCAIVSCVALDAFEFLGEQEQHKEGSKHEQRDSGNGKEPCALSSEKEQQEGLDQKSDEKSENGDVTVPSLVTHFDRHFQVTLQMAENNKTHHKTTEPEPGVPVIDGIGVGIGTGFLPGDIAAATMAYMCAPPIIDAATTLESRQIIEAFSEAPYSCILRINNAASLQPLYSPDYHTAVFNPWRKFSSVKIKLETWYMHAPTCMAASPSTTHTSSSTSATNTATETEKAGESGRSADIDTDTVTTDGLHIHNQIQRCPITEIDQRFFYHCNNITELDLSSPNSTNNADVDGNTGPSPSAPPHLGQGQGFPRQSSITKIHSSFMDGCRSLTNVHLPDELSVIDGGFLWGCISLEKIDLSRTAISLIPDNCLAECKSLQSAAFPPTLTSLGNYVLKGCRQIDTIDMSNTNVSRIGHYFMAECTGLVNLKLPKPLKDVGNQFLGYCANLQQFDANETQLQRLGYHFLCDCTSLERVVLPTTVKEVGVRFLDGCTGIRVIESEATAVIKAKELIVVTPRYVPPVVSIRCGRD